MKKFFRSLAIFFGLIRPYQYFAIPLTIEWPLMPGSGTYNDHHVSKKKPVRVEKTTKQVQAYVPDIETDWRDRPVERYSWKSLPEKYQKELSFQLKNGICKELRVSKEDYTQVA